MLKTSLSILSIIFLAINCSPSISGIGMKLKPHVASKHHIIRIGYSKIYKEKPIPIKISSIDISKDGKLVEVRGEVVYVRHKKGRNNIAFVLNDGSGELKIYSPIGRYMLFEKGMLPSIGDEVNVIGRLTVSKEYGTLLVPLINDE